MDKGWKTVIITISSMVCAILICIAINVSVTKITAKISDQPYNEEGQNSSYEENSYIPQGGGEPAAQEGTTAAQNAAQQAQTPKTANNAANASNGNSSSATPSGSGGNSSAQASSADPLSYNKAQIVSYYNSCLNKSYSQPKMTATRNEHIDLSFNKDDITVNGSKLNDKMANLVQKVVNANTKDKSSTKTFKNGVASDGTPASVFVLPTRLSPSGVRSASVTKNGSGYRINITLVQESCDFRSMPQHNKSCAWPLDFRDINFLGMGEITSATFNYPGTKLIANIDSQGRANYVEVDMPLTVNNGQGKALGVPISIAKITGQWTCKDTMTF